MGVISNLMFAVGFKVNDAGLQAAEEQINSVTTGIVGFGLAAGAALAGFGIASIHAASEFEKAMSNVQMATGSSAEQMSETKELAKELYSENFGENWGDLGQAIKSVQQVTGQTGDALEETTRNALLMRDAFGLEINESVKSADTMMKQFGLTSDQAFSLLAQGQQKGLDKSGDLMDTANEYSNQFKALGFSAEEMFDTLAAGSQNGAFNLDKVGDAVKEFNIRAKDGSKASIEAFQMLGLDADKMMSTFATGGPKAKQAFTQVMQMISSIEDPVQRNTVGVALMGTQFEDLEAPVIAAMGTARSQFDMTQNSMDEINKVRFDSPGQAIAMFGRQLETGILLPVGEKMLPYLTQFGQWMADNKPQIEAVGAAIGNGLGAAIDSVASSFAFLSENIDYIGPALAAFGLVILYSLLPAMWGWITAQWAAAVAGWAAIAPWLPFIAIGLAVAAAVMGIIYVFKHWGEISTWLGEKWTIFKDWIFGVFQSIGDFFTDFWDGVTAVFTGFVTKVAVIFEPIIHYFIATWENIKLVVLGIVGFFISALTGDFEGMKISLLGIWDGLKSQFFNVINTIKTVGINLLNGFMNSLPTIWEGIKSGATAAWELLKNAVINSVVNMKNGIWNTLTSVTSFFSDTKNRIISTFTGIDLFEIGKNIIDGLINGITSMTSAVVDKMKSLGSSITNEIKDTLGIHSPSRVMMEIGGWTGEGLALGISGTEGMVSDASTNLATESVSPVEKIAPAITPANSPAASTAVQASGSMRLDINLSVDVNGGDMPAQAVNDLREKFDQMLAEAVESAIRRMGLSGGVAVGDN